MDLVRTEAHPGTAGISISTAKQVQRQPHRRGERDRAIDTELGIEREDEKRTMDDTLLYFL